MFSKVKNIHFVGIGGIGMSGIAEILLSQGFNISGSDMARSENTEYLENLGAKVYIGHHAGNIENAEVVVYSSAVKPDKNEETVAAMQKNIPVIRRAEMLAQVSRLNYCLAIAGTHGKTTTTSMLGLVLMKAGIDPTVIVGGRLKDLGGTNARLGKGEWTVVEADEYDRSFLQLSPTIAVINNIESDHLDIYEDIDDLKRTFTDFGSKVPFYGFLALGLDDVGVTEILSEFNKNVITFGLLPHCDFRADNISYNNGKTSCTVYERGEVLGEMEILIPGEHNIKNALAAVAVARNMDIEFDIIKSALAEFGGVFRRFEIKGVKDDVLVIDDYAHHPTEVAATLAAARRGYSRRVICCFQPHTYTRTRDLYKEFGRSFFESDVLVLTDIYPARELPIEGISGQIIADAAKKYGHRNVHYVEDKAKLRSYISTIAEPGDLIITMGAGDIWKLGNEIVENGFIK